MPWKNGSLMVTFLMPTMRCCPSTSMIRSTGRKDSDAAGRAGLATWASSAAPAVLRHKAADILGDLALTGGRRCGAHIRRDATQPRGNIAWRGR